VDNKHLTETILDHSLWWALKVYEGHVEVVVSPAFDALLPKKINSYEDFVSVLAPDCGTLFVRKMPLWLEADFTSERFLVGFQLQGRIGRFISDVRVCSRDDVRSICANCVEVSEMHDLEKQLVESHSRLEIEKLQLKEEQAVKEAALLKQQYEEQTQFLAMLSHELRSPLVGMSSLINVIRKKIKAEQSVDGDLKVIRLTIDQLNFLINDILTFSQTQSDHVQLNPSPFSLHEMSDYVGHLTKSIATQKGVFVSFSLKTEHEMFYGDLVRVSQILLNLIVNAIKFTEYGGVFVEVLEKNDMVEFIVTDSGEGISQDELGSIFKPFKQLDSNGSKQYIGSGLGLSIVKTLVDLMGGEISVASTKGVGTTFTMSLPLLAGQHPVINDQILDHTQEEGAASDVSSQLASRSQKSAYKVLIADDSEINRRVLQFFLEEANCEVHEANDGGEAWQKIQQDQFDFVFLDIQMPVLNGSEVCEKIRQLSKAQTQGIKGVFALTAAHTESEIDQMGVKVNKNQFDVWVEKPVSQDKVLHLLNFGQTEKSSIQTKSDVYQPPDALAHLFEQFIESTEKEFELLYVEWRQKDEKALKARLHTLKGNFMLFELKSLVQLIQRLEKMDLVKEGDKMAVELGVLEKKFRTCVKLP